MRTGLPSDSSSPIVCQAMMTLGVLLQVGGSLGNRYRRRV